MPARESCASLIVALIGDQGTRAHLRQSLSASGRLEFCARNDDLLGLVIQHRASVVITELWDITGAATAPAVRRLHAHSSSIPILAYCTLTRNTSQELYAMVRAGISGILFRGLDDVGEALRSALGHADERCLARLVTEAMAPAVPPEARVLIEFCMEHARTAPTVAEIASELGVHRKTLVNWMMQAHLPAPSAVTAWSRILLAARRLDEPGRSVEHVALDLGFGSASELRNMMRRYTGLRPGEIRERGGFTLVLELFLRARDEVVPHRELPIARRRTVRHSRRPYIRRSLRSPHPA